MGTSPYQAGGPGPCSLAADCSNLHSHSYENVCFDDIPCKCRDRLVKHENRKDLMIFENIHIICIFLYIERESLLNNLKLNLCFLKPGEI